MPIRRLILLALAALFFATAMLYLLTDRRGGPRTEKSAVAAEPVAFGGKLDIRTMADLRVGGRKVMLCGVSFNRPASLEPLAREQARQVFQGREVNCVQVGGGTPCDGRVAPVFQDVPVMQCREADGSDIARALSDSGYLCDVPMQSGGAYHAC